MEVIFKKMQDAQPMGEYKRTPIDDAKANADFRLIDVSGTKKLIQWKSGLLEKVSSRQLAKLQAIHTWVTDF